MQWFSFWNCSKDDLDIVRLSMKRFKYVGTSCSNVNEHVYEVGDMEDPYGQLKHLPCMKSHTHIRPELSTDKSCEDYLRDKMYWNFVKNKRA